MNEAEKFRLKMMEFINSSIAEVRSSNGIIVMQFRDGSLLDFTEPKSQDGGKEIPSS